MSQGVLAGDVIQIVVKSTGFSDSFYHSSASKIELGIVMCLLVLNYFNYRKKYWTLRERWSGDGHSFIKGVLVILALITPFILWYLLVKTISH